MITSDKKHKKDDDYDSDSLLKKNKKKKRNQQHNKVLPELEEEAKCQCSCMPIKYGIKAVYNFITKGIGGCFGVCCYPVKERLVRQCDEADRDMNPYKDPNYNPYDYL